MCSSIVHVSWFLSLLVQPTVAAATASGACGTGWVEPEHSVSVREAVGGGTHQRRLLVVKVTLPGLHSVSQVQLDVSRVTQHTHTQTYTHIQAYVQRSIMTIRDNQTPPLELCMVQIVQ